MIVFGIWSEGNRILLKIYKHTWQYLSEAEKVEEVKEEGAKEEKAEKEEGAKEEAEGERFKYGYKMPESWIRLLLLLSWGSGFLSWSQ